MTSSRSPEVDICDLIKRRDVEIHFQLIASIRRGAIVGVEALSRGIHSSGYRIPPAKLFGLAATKSLTLELDKLCRTTALETFLPLHTSNPNLVLFLNLHSSTIEQDVDTADGLLSLVRRLNIDPRNVAIEILETEFKNAARLQESVKYYKNNGFLVVLDDVGAGHSNLDRIAYIKPDIIKADRSLVHNVHNDYYKQEVLKALVNLSEKIGGWVIIEGVETQEEAICVLDFGADLLQGFYLARPDRIASIDELRLDLKQVRDTAIKFKHYTIDKTKTVQSQREQRLTISKDIAVQMETILSENFEEQLRQIICNYPTVESACILNAAGIQITETIRNPRSEQRQKTIIFQPPAKGTNHSFKEYYYLLAETSIEPFETQPYVPLPSGDLCITTSIVFNNMNGRPFILCLHMSVART